jgi:hypothetical protein
VCAQSSEAAFVTHYGASVLILTGYSVAVWYYLETNSRYAGLIVSITVLVMDGCLYLYATTGRLSDNTTKLVLLAVTRIILISFGEENWFVAQSAVYTLAACFLVYAVVDYHWPLQVQPLQQTYQNKGYKMRYSFVLPFVSLMQHPTIDVM